jgi:hypothetical protein
LLALAEECIGANIAARQQELRLELLLLEAPLLGQRMSVDLPQPMRPPGHMSEDLPQPTPQDLRSPQHRRMAGRVMATAQGPTRTL